MLVLEASEPRDLVAARELRLGLLRKRDEVLEVPPARLVAVARGREPLERVFAHDLEHREARLAGGGLALPHEALVDECAEPFEDRGVTVADGLGRGERPAAGEDAEPFEKLLRVGIEQVVAPVERHAQRLLMPWRITPAARQQLQPVSESRQQRRRREELRPRSGELDRERQAVESRTELGDGGRVLLAQREVGIGGLRARDEQLGRLIVG